MCFVTFLVEEDTQIILTSFLLLRVIANKKGIALSHLDILEKTFVPSTVMPPALGFMLAPPHGAESLRAQPCS